MVPINHQITKKRKKPTTCSIIGFFNTRILYQKTNPTQEQFLEDLVFYIAKGYCPFSSTKNISLKRLVHH
jgi:hypothetical protein